MAPWNWRNPCTSGSTDSDESSQTATPVRKRTQKQNVPPNNTGAANSLYQNPNFNATTKHITPVLFSTNRGLHLRVAKSISKPCVASGACACSGAAGNISRCEALNASNYGIAGDGDSGNNLSTTIRDYDIHFCDLERWSTNRANTICLEDTFIVSRRNNCLNSPNSSSSVESNGNLNSRMQRSGSIFCVPSGSRHALVMPRRSLYQRSTSIQSTFERFGVH